MNPPKELVVVGPRPLRGRLRLPGDKGISHRALIAGALAPESSDVTNLAPGDDVERTAAALRALGVTIETDGTSTAVHGRGIDALRAPDDEIDCGNSGTTMRILAGLLAGRPFRSVLTGDDSLSARPMARIIQPLRALGAQITGRDGDRFAPLMIEGRVLNGAKVELEVASGQVKTAAILAGMQASGVTEIVEPAPSRDHTERLFAALGVPIERGSDRAVVVRAGMPRAFELEVPGDPSSAAFFVVAAAVTPGSDVLLEDVLLNSTRIGFIDSLRAMGAPVEVTARGTRLGEDVGDIHVASASLHGATIQCEEGFIDEVPALAVAAAFAEGETEIKGAGELRVKESDRVATIQQELTQLGVSVEAIGDSLLIRGGRPHAAILKSHGDHRIAMAAAIAANAAEGESHVRGWQSVAVSYPAFAADLESLSAS